MTYITLTMEIQRETTIITMMMVEMKLSKIQQPQYLPYLHKLVQQPILLHQLL